MKKLIAVLLASAVAFPAVAGDYTFSTPDSHGPRQPNPYTSNDYTGTRPSSATIAQLRAAGFAVVERESWGAAPWVNDASPKGFVDQYSTLDAQLAASKAHDRATYDRVVEEGGCNADFIPVYIHEYCNEVAFGNPIGGKGGD